MYQNHRFCRRLRMSAYEVVVAWTDPKVMARWFWPHLNASYQLVRRGAGDAYRISSQITGITVSGTCLQWNRDGFDMTCHVDGAGFVQEGHDTLSVRLFPVEGEGCELVLTYAVNSNIEPQLVDRWEPMLDRLAELDLSAVRVH